ncbi:uncharacterized protein LOC143020037 [Oratosquilla oratoria]|uniref:uncharacterized protein LOC143018247 n=1 Tax=Oratosquilla oratoria TaxID=337810 RepID=UPI003F766194
MRNHLVLILAMMATAARGFSNCRCGLMTTLTNGMNMIYELPALDMGSCTNHFECKQRCTKEYNDLTHNGDMYHMIDAFTSVGQFLCQEFKYDLHNEYVYPYYELCNGPWQYADSHSKQMLCCRNHEQYQCTSRGL